MTGRTKTASKENLCTLKPKHEKMNNDGSEGVGHPDIEPLDPILWFRQLAKLSKEAAKPDGEASERLIRKAMHLAALAPGPVREFLPDAVDEAMLEEMIERGGHELAVLNFVGPKARVCTGSKTKRGGVEVAITLPQLQITGTGRHEDLAKATLGAWADCFLNLEKAAKEIKPPRPVPRIFRSAQLRASTEH